jgi:hypothetical protein
LLLLPTAAAAANCCCCCFQLLLLLQLMHGVWPEGLYEPLQQVIDVARLAASLQPDGTCMPEVRCLVVCHCCCHCCLLV